MRISDWSSDVCSSDLFAEQVRSDVFHELLLELRNLADALADAVELMHRRSVVEKVVPESHLDINQVGEMVHRAEGDDRQPVPYLSVTNSHAMLHRSEEHTSELQSLMRISYAVFCLKKKNQIRHKIILNLKNRNNTKTH